MSYGKLISCSCRLGDITHFHLQETSEIVQLAKFWLLNIKIVLQKTSEASPHKRELKCDTKHQSQEADATFITSDGSKPYKPWRTLDTDNNNN